LRHLCHLQNRELNRNVPKFKGGSIEAVKVPTKSGTYRAAIVYHCHKKVTDGIGSMNPLQAILTNSLECILDVAKVQVYTGMPILPAF
jgi:hypothetical protein